jgi:hypothetical protein
MLCLECGDDVASLEGGSKDSLDIGQKVAPFIGPSNRKGAVTRLWRSAKVPVPSIEPAVILAVVEPDMSSTLPALMMTRPLPPVLWSLKKMPPPLISGAGGLRLGLSQIPGSEEPAELWG